MGANPPVLLVDADADHLGSMKQMLATMPYAVIGDASYGVEAAHLAGQLQPEIILLHIEEPLALAFRTLEVLQEAAPQATPVVISRDANGETARKAMLYGARGYVVSPCTAEELQTVLTAARSRHQRLIPANGAAMPSTPAVLASGMVITVFGPKGGVGKTTLATNLAIAIRMRTQARVALVDVDADFGDVAVIMGIEPEHTVRDILRAYAEGGTTIVSQYVTHHPSGVDVLAARHVEEVGAPPDPALIGQLLQQLAKSYDFVVVDTPGAFIPQVAAALDEATTVLLVTSTDMSSIKDARLALTTLKGSGFGDDRLKLVVNHATNANSVTESDIARTVGYEVFWTLPHDRAVPHSTQLGRPIVVSEPRAEMAMRVDALAAYFGGTGTPAEPQRKRGLFGF
jgi:pilus assembly protein CpaE